MACAPVVPRVAVGPAVRSQLLLHGGLDRANSCGGLWLQVSGVSSSGQVRYRWRLTSDLPRSDGHGDCCSHRRLEERLRLQLL